MTGWTLPDAVYRAMARHVDRPVLALVASQRLLRPLFAVSARAGSALPKGTRMIRTPDGALHLRPAGVAADAPVLMYIHGGGFTIGSPRTHAALAGHLAAAAGMRAVLPRYRLAPEHPFPAAQHDIFAAHKALVEAGTPPVAVCGDSAGGCLALQLAVHLRDTGQGVGMPRALGLIGPVADLSGRVADRFAGARDEMLIPPVWADRIEAAYLPGIDRTDPAVSPLLGDLTGLPPTLIQASADEALAQDARRLWRALDGATLDLWPGLPHVWHLHAGRGRSANRALVRMGAWLADHAGP